MYILVHNISVHIGTGNLFIFFLNIIYMNTLLKNNWRHFVSVFGGQIIFMNNPLKII